MTFLKKFLHSRKMKLSLIPLAACVAAVLIVLLSISLAPRSSAHADVSLSAQPVGIGMGVPACESSVGPSCAANGDVLYTVTWDESAADGNSPSCDSEGDSSVTIVINRSTDGAWVASQGGLPCVGTYNFAFPPTAGATYGVYIMGSPSNLNYDGSSAAPITTFTAPTACDAPPPPPPPPTPTASLTADGGTSVVVNVGDTINYAWSSTNGVSAATTYTIDSPDSSCGFVGTGPFPWVAGNTLSGTYTSTPQAACKAGHTFTFTYVVTSATGATASSVVAETVANTGSSCPIGYTGTPPNCVPSSGSCPLGYTGTPPNCVLAGCVGVCGGVSCPLGYTGTPPNCVIGGGSCPVGYTGTPPNCVISSGCSTVYSGTPPLCILPPPVYVPTLSLTATPQRVRNGSSANITWLTQNVTSCTVTQNGVLFSSATSGTNVPSNPITAQTTFTLTCNTSSGPQSTSAVVNLIPDEIEI